MVVSVSSLLGVALALAGCARDHAPSGSGGPASGADVVRIGGSTTLYPGLALCAERFMASGSDLEVEVSQSSSGAGIAKLIAGQLDIAGASREPHGEEFDEAMAGGIALKPYHIAYDAVLVIVHPELSPYLEGLRLDQVRAIFFDGTVTNWSQLTEAAEGPIRVYVRTQDNSGTAEIFTETVSGNKGTPYVAGAIEIKHTPNMVPEVAGDRQGIGFAPLGHVDDSVVALPLGISSERLVKPTRDAVRDLRYVLRRDLFVISRGTPLGTANEFLHFLLGPDGQTGMDEAGLVSLN